MDFGHQEHRLHREPLLVVVQEEAQEAEAVDKCVLYVTMALEMEVQVQVVADKVVTAVQVVMAVEALLVYI
jgi:hypothetical protein